MIKKILVVLPGAVLMLIVLYFVLTTVPSIRLWVDEFCTSALLKQEGFLKAQIYWWNNWTGKYSFVALHDIFEELGPWTTRVTPLVILPLLIAAIVPAVSGVLLAAVFVVLTIVNAPNISQVFYWQMGSINYLAPFIFLNLFLSLLIIKTKVNLI